MKEFRLKDILKDLQVSPYHGITNMTLIQEEVTEFLKKTPPFQFLEDGEVADLARAVTIEYYPKGTRILTQGGSPSRYLSVVKKGGVKVLRAGEGGEDAGFEYRGEGDSFGFVSLIGEDRARNSIVAVEDTVCYQVERETVLRLIEHNPAFTEFFLKSFFIKSIDKTYEEMYKRSMLCPGGDKMLFTTPVGGLSLRKAVSESQDISVREAARVMAGNNISSLVLLDGEGAPVGIVTDRDLRIKVVAKGRELDTPVREVMTRTLLKVDSREYCFEALLKMLRYGVHHLLVVEGGELKSILTNHDLMLLQGISPVSLVKDIESRHTVEELKAAATGVNRVIALLLKEGARAGNVTRIITEINDRLVRQAIELAVRKNGKPPVPFCWIAFGSEGRREQTFKTDQDNAIIFADPLGKDDEAREYFARLASEVNDTLVGCGFPVCPAGYMAQNPMWHQPLKAWKDYFHKWIYNPTPDAVLSSLIFFDFRPVWGEAKLAEELRDAMGRMIADQPVFLAFMVNTILQNRPPIGFFKTFVVEKDGEHKDQLNLKIKGITPLVDLVRLFALEKGVRETSTLDRLTALKDKHDTVRDLAEEMEHAFEFIMMLRIHHQLSQIESGTKPDNFINPDTLTGLEKKTIKDAFNLISGLQDAVVERYRPMIW